MIRNRESLQSVPPEVSAVPPSDDLPLFATRVEPTVHELEELAAPVGTGRTRAPRPLEERFAELRSRVRTVFGFPELRPFQGAAMRAALAGRDALVVLPTGGGKSLCYQAPALVRDGLTVVVSPLIALMKDQVDGLSAHGVLAAMWTSAQDADERGATARELESGELKLLFVSPERLLMPGFLERLERAGLEAIAVDEAHCISHWGHDFRPEYRQLGELRGARRNLCIQAFTATATPRVQDDIAEQLGLVDPVRIVGDFDRPNLTYRTLPRADLAAQTLGVLRRHPGRAGIVYCLRRKDAERLAQQLAAQGVRCRPYHAGLEPRERRSVQEAFAREAIDVVVATVAFGMGIDRPDVRSVVHASLPKGVEQYSQETGRAGRDGLPSECVLFYAGADVHALRGLIERSARESETPVAPDELAGALARLDEMWRFAASPVCRHRLLVEHFGQAWEAGRSCGACDVCLGELEALDDSTIVAQKILSCVAHVRQRYGATHVADVLRGAHSARVRQAGHESLSTYGLLADLSGADLRALIDQLLARGELALGGGEWPTLRLTHSGLEVLRGEREVRLSRPRRAARARSRPRAPDEPGADPELFEVLRGLRRRLARERGVPPYLLFNDRTLAAMSGSKPRTREEFLELKGVGEKKATDLGPIFLAAIAEHLEASER